MSVAIKKIDGVQSVNVSLNQGLARIVLKQGNAVRLEQMDQAVKNNGFTPKEARVKVHGQVMVTGGKSKFKVLGTNDVYDLVTDAAHSKLSNDLAKHAGKNIVIEGIIPAPSKGRSQNVIQVLSLEAGKGV